MKNIILIVSDQHSGAASGFAGHPYVKTPNLDGLAKDSLIFRNAYCPAPICGPSRFAMLTGQHVHRCGSYDNGSSLRYDEPTLGHMMTNAGYRSILCGRMHIHGPEQLVGFEERPAVGWINPLHSPPASMLPDDYAYPEFDGYERGEDYDHFQEDKLKLSSIDNYTVEAACGIINGHKKEDKRPLFMVVGLYGPHPSVAKRDVYKSLIEMYDKMDIEAPDFSYDLLCRESPYLRNTALLLGKGKLPDQELNRRLLCEYFARITYTDMLIGKVLDAMRNSEIYDDSYLIYVSDHGENMGDKGIWGKVTFQENSVNVPFLIKEPQSRRKDAVDSNVSLVDIFPTLAELASCRVDYELSGQSLVPMFRSGKTNLQRTVLSQYHGTYTRESAFMLKTGKLKYNYYIHSEPELFDLENDPHENNNLVALPEYREIVQELHQELLDKLGTSPEAVEKMIRQNQLKRSFIADSVGKSPVIKHRLKTRIKEWRKKRGEPWWDDEGERYMRNYEPHLHD